MSGFDYKSIDIEQPKMPKLINNSSNSFDFEVNSPKTETLELSDFYDKNNEFKTESIPLSNDEIIADNVVDKGDYMGLDGDYDEIIDIFGGQHDNYGLYGYHNGECDNYARGYAIYLQTGKIVPFGEMTVDADGMVVEHYYANSRKEQAEFAYKMIKEEGKPCIIHVNSGHDGSGKGHWLCVVGYKKGVTEENVTIGDLIVIDSDGQKDQPITAKVRPVSEDSYYCMDGFDRCSYKPGYQIYYYSEEK